MSFEGARRIADAVLYEGYVLYPYRASSRKNRYRWTFGVVAPRSWSEAGGCEPWSRTLECLIETRSVPRVEGRLRFLHVERREVEEAQPDGRFRPVETLGEHITWEEGIERELPFSLAPLNAQLPECREERALTGGRMVITQHALEVHLTASVAPVAPGLWKLTLVLENRTPFLDFAASREQAVAAALVGAHLLLSVEEGAFVSQLDPPPPFKEASQGCHSVGWFPVLAGDLLFVSPIVLYDHPQIAAESPGDSFDGTEIDELLTLSTRSLTDEEKREARATSRRSAEVIDRAEKLSNDALLALHGRRSMLERGSRVRVRLGARRGDAQDMFLDGRIGTVEEVREDVDGQTHLAVILEDDPGADLNRWYGRHLHFRPDELELL